MTPSAAAVEARAWLASGRQAVLGTVSADAASAGWPFLSVVPYALDAGRRPVMLLAGIAQHTRNLIADDRASLIVSEPGLADPQAGWRLTLLGRMRRLVRASETAGPRDRAVDDAALEALHARYREAVPLAGGYLASADHGFRYWVLDEVVRARAIGGFGRIGWIDPAELLEV